MMTSRGYRLVGGTTERSGDGDAVALHWDEGYIGVSIYKDASSCKEQNPLW